MALTAFHRPWTQPSLGRAGRLRARSCAPSRRRHTSFAVVAGPAVVQGVAARAPTAMTGQPEGALLGQSLATYAACFVACALSGALAACLVAAIPLMTAAREAALEIAALAAALRRELPDTLASVRLSSLEMSDCAEEVRRLSQRSIARSLSSAPQLAGLGADLGDGLRTSARAIVSARDGVQRTSAAITNQVVPAARRALPAARKAATEAVRERAALKKIESLGTLVRGVRSAVKAVGVVQAVQRLVRSTRFFENRGDV